MRIVHWLEKRAALTPHRLACISKDGRLTFAELRDHARQAAAYLASAGIGQGAHVAVLCHNRLPFPVLIHALQYLGAVLVPLNTRLTASELMYQIRDAGCSWLIYDDEHLHKLQLQIAAEMPQITAIDIAEVNRRDSGREISLDSGEWMVSEGLQLELESDSLHTIMYTSGTTGNPKGVMLSYDNFWASAIGSALNLGLNEHDHWLVCVPMFHISGLSIVMRSVIYGIPMTIHERFNPQEVNRAIIEQGITIVSVVSTMLSQMIEALGERRYPAHLRCILLGGGPVPDHLLAQCQEKEMPVFQTFGMTETTSQLATLSADVLQSKPGSAGKPLFQADLRIMKDGAPVAPLTAGEIMVRGPQVTRGYWNNAEATANAIQDGWLATGDIGYLDDEGFLYVLDRRADLIISGGENVYPAEVEAVLLQHPDIAEAGVVGRDDEKWGQAPVAFVVLRSEARLDEQGIRAHCAEHLAKYKIPIKIYAVEKLPRTAMNKLRRKELLREIFRQRDES